MSIMTLDELNRDFIYNGKVRSHSSGYEPIIPRAYDLKQLELPEKPVAVTSASSALRSADSTGKAKPSGRGTPDPFSQDFNLAKQKCQAVKRSRGIITTISDILFSLAIIIVMFVVLVPGADGDVPKMILNYSYFTVVSPSMKDELPVGSLILVKHVDPMELKVGDNITFVIDRNTTVTHKISEIYENYDRSGARGFQTQGTSNINQDPYIVYESSVVGKVAAVIPYAGAVLSYLNDNVFLLFILFGLCVLLSFLLRGVIKRPKWREIFQKSNKTAVPDIPGSAHPDVRGCRFVKKAASRKRTRGGP